MGSTEDEPGFRIITYDGLNAADKGVWANVRADEVRGPAEVRLTRPAVPLGVTEPFAVGRVDPVEEIRARFNRPHAIDERTNYFRPGYFAAPCPPREPRRAFLIQVHGDLRHGNNAILPARGGWMLIQSTPS